MKTAQMMITVLISLVWAATASALDVKLQWDPNTESDLAGYKVYYGVNGLASPEHLDVNNQTIATVTGLDPAQNYSFAVAAYNTSGLEGPYSNVVTALESVLPVVSIYNLGNNTKVSNTVEVRATASDNVGVVKVEYYLDGVLTAIDGAEPYQYSWDTLTVTPGTHTITVKAYDAAGNIGISTVSVTVVNDLTPPVISQTAPLQGSSVGGSVTVSCTASDDVGVTRVEFFVNGVMGAALNTTPYKYQWDATSVPNGSYILTAKAYDAADHVTTSPAVTVTVNNPVSDTTDPTVSIGTPANGTALNGAVVVTASANDAAGVSRVEFYLNGALASTDTTAPYSFTWDTTAVANGPHTLTAKAYDAAGNTGQSSTVTVSVANVAVTPPPAAAYSLADALFALRVAVGALNPTPEQRLRTDVAPVDGKIDISDALGILRDVVGIRKLVL